MYSDIIAILFAIAGTATPDQMRKLVSSIRDDEHTKDISKITCPKPYDNYYLEFDYDLNRWVFKKNGEV